MLASADPANITPVTGQRIDEASDQPETVRYFRQRATTGEVRVAGDLDGFRFHVEPNSAVAPDTELVPFAIARGPADANDPDGQVLAVGVAHDPTGATPGPVAITVDPSALQVFQVDVELASVTTANVTAQQVAIVDCNGAPSGLVWRPAAGQELRVLLPLPGDSEDATARPLDLDCDGHEPIASAGAAAADCDDLAADVFAGAPETCDGRDANCDGQPTRFEACTAGSGCTGLAVCNGGSAGACKPDLDCPNATPDATCDVATAAGTQVCVRRRSAISCSRSSAATAARSACSRATACGTPRSRPTRRARSARPR